MRASSGPDWGLPVSILDLLGDKVHILHPMAAESAELGGGDIDCAVSGIDFSWPLRLPLEYRLVQYLHYDVRGWAWVLERNGVFVIVDAIDDPSGINRLGFATSSLSRQPGHLVGSLTRAAYLAAKRVWKGQVDQPSWAAVRQLMGDGGADFVTPLRQTFGRNVAAELEMSIRRGQVIDRYQWMFARTTQMLRRFSSPSKAASLLYLGPARVVERLIRPTGLFVLLLDRREDGQALASPQVAQSLRGPLMRQSIIDTPGTGRTREARASSSVPSLFVGWLRALTCVPLIWKHRIAKGLIIVQGGWWQDAFFQGGGSARRRTATFLAGLLPSPDLTFVVGHRGEDALRLPTTDLEFIRRAMRGRVCVVDQHGLVRDVQEAGLAILESRVVRQLGTGWTELPAARSAWIIPRGPRSAVMNALAIHQPAGQTYTPWAAGVKEAAIGGLVRLLPRSASPPAEIRALLTGHLLPHGTLSIARTSKPGRFIATILDGKGSPQAVAKLATDPAGVEALARERTHLENLNEHTTDVLRIPKVIVHEPGVLLLEPELWLRQREPWRIPVEIANAVGHLIRQGGGGPSDNTGLVHGDCTYLNLRLARRGWILLDWEDARESERGMFDLFQHLFVSHAMFGRPSVVEIRNGLGGAGWLSDVADAYVAGIGIQIDDLADAFLDFLFEGTKGSAVEPPAWKSTRRLLAQELRS